MIALVAFTSSVLPSMQSCRTPGMQSCRTPGLSMRQQPARRWAIQAGAAAAFAVSTKAFAADPFSGAYANQGMGSRPEGLGSAGISSYQAIKLKALASGRNSGTGQPRYPRV